MHNRSGFSLVELSIVLVILGLLVGGVLSGQSLIAAAEVRKAMEQSTQYQTAVWTFRDKYFAMPGDMTNADKFWTAAAGKNGNGNGIVNEGTDETAYVWLHLSQAGLIEGSYDGVRDPTYPPTMVPRGIRNSEVAMFAEGSSMYGVEGSSRTFILYSPRSATAPFTATEAWNIDTKLDDGIAGHGRVISTQCADGPISQTSPLVQYNLTCTNKAQVFFYVQ